MSERRTRTYKISDKCYKRGMKAAKKNGKKLATLIEEFVIEYGLEHIGLPKTKQNKKIIGAIEYVKPDYSILDKIESQK